MVLILFMYSESDVKSLFNRYLDFNLVGSIGVGIVIQDFKLIFNSYLVQVYVKEGCR